MKDKEHTLDELAEVIVDAVMESKYLSRNELLSVVRTVFKLRGKDLKENLPDIERWKFKCKFWYWVVKEMKLPDDEMRRLHSKLVSDAASIGIDLQPNSNKKSYNFNS